MAQWVTSVAHFHTRRCGYESQRGRVVGVGPSLAKPMRQIHGLVVLMVTAPCLIPIFFGVLFSPVLLGFGDFLSLGMGKFLGWNCCGGWIFGLLGARICVTSLVFG